MTMPTRTAAGGDPEIRRQHRESTAPGRSTCRRPARDALRAMMMGRSCWPSDPHLPPIIRLRPDNGDPPMARPITENVFNKRNNFRPHYGIARILHVHRHCHTAAVYAFHCTNLRQLTPFLRQAYVCLIGVSP